MERISKRKYYLNIARAVSKRSSCLKRRYGCIIVKNDEIIATGFNGSPRGLANCCDVGACSRINTPNNSGDYSTCFSVHAEQNAMLSAARKDMINSTLYLAGEQEWEEDVFEEIRDCQPCPLCDRMIRNAGISKVITIGGVTCL